ncbi:MAG: hypothetical protein C5B60_09855 [Chloroflexi bacterium]|nr:MAG: hypothetical protein C5B60_09855 [Chloroflexota bacterium]
MNDLTIVGLEWLGGVTVFLVFILLLRYLEHRERMSMIERGMLQPEANQHPSYPRGSAQLRGGLITAGVGFALTVGLYNLGWLLPAPLTAAPGRIGPWLLPGLIPLAIGLALVAGYYLSPPHQESETTSSNGDREKAEGNPVSGSSKRHRGWYLVESSGEEQDVGVDLPRDTTTGTTDAPSAT